MIKIKVSKTFEDKLRKGHPWVHHYQIQNKVLKGKPGDLGVIYDRVDRLLAVGLYDPHSEIRMRILQRKESVVLDETFFENRIQTALKIRAELGATNTTAFRVINGENDGLPGLIIDRYDDTWVVKLYTSAWGRYLSKLEEVIKKIQGVGRILLLLSRHVQRTPHSCPDHRTVLYGPPVSAPIKFLENGMTFFADVSLGQKTGFFLDQRENRDRVRALAQSMDVLNVFSYTSGFSVYALDGGCKSVTEVDVNAHALKMGKENVLANMPQAENDRELFKQIEGDAFKTLESLSRKKQEFDMVILDPPAFANQNKHKKNALQAYYRLVKLGATCTRSGGVLFCASCSSKVKADEFYRMCDLALRSLGIKAKKLFKSRHPVDHPVTFPEGNYLKAICFKI